MALSLERSSGRPGPASFEKHSFEKHLANYFRERLHDIASQLAPAPHEDTLWYTSHMLARFGSSREFFTWNEGSVSIRPLALLYKDAHECGDERTRCLLLRQLGDMALFMGALFPDNYARRGIHKDYFVGMGGGAYDYLADNAAQNRHVFLELASTFTRMLELVARACSKQHAFDSRDILKLYERWQLSGDPLLAEQLRALGVDISDDSIVH